jgi:hypothetical protein
MSRRPSVSAAFLKLAVLRSVMGRLNDGIADIAGRQFSHRQLRVDLSAQPTHWRWGEKLELGVCPTLVDRGRAVPTHEIQARRNLRV